MKVLIGGIKPNPFRHLERYPIKRDKVEALKSSIASTGFWDNIVAREGPDGPEIAYGHHRLIALQESFNPKHKVELIVRDLSDTKMLQIMAAENMQEWEHSAEIEQETVRAVIEAYRAGLIELPKPDRNRDRSLSATVKDKPYTAETIAEFLGWKVWKVETALKAIRAIEAGTVTEDDFVGLGPRTGKEIVRQAERASRIAIGRGTAPKEAERIGRQIASGLASEFRKERDPDAAPRASLHTASQWADEQLQELVPATVVPTVPAKVAEELWADVDAFFSNGLRVNGTTLSRRDVAALIAENRDAAELQGIAAPWATQIADALDRLASEAERLSGALRGAPLKIAVGARS